ncbi:MAG: 16S rRNA (guanine(527)-N(7))-methyltransferase RsmG [Clostridia bacterium]|nr:16S rRNA (guanine(527)-N(7))-methyltransferase RsmG [Clostridia bacterium]
MAERKIAPTVDESTFALSYRRIAAEAGLDGEFLTDSLVHTLYGIYACLLEASHKFNLTAITEHTAVAERHLVDSLIPFSMLSQMGLLKDGDALCDIGAGAGFPSLPAAAAANDGALPDITVHSVDSTAKKIGHITDTAKRLSLSNVSGTAGRAEELARGDMRESFNIVTARAVSAMPVLIELAAPFVKVGGIFAAMKAHSDEEVTAAAKGAEILGFTAAETHEYTLPSGDVRSLVIYRKVKPTPDAYPRQYSKITSKPL